MAVQETTPTVGAMARLDRAQARPEAAEPAAKPVRRLPVQKDWPTWALIAAQIGILVGALSLWETGARTGWIDAFFWSQPSAIAQTMAIFFTTGDAWTDISFTFLDHSRFSYRHHSGLAARAVVLVVAQLRRHRATLRDLPGIDPEARAG